LWFEVREKAGLRSTAVAALLPLGQCKEGEAVAPERSRRLREDAYGRSPTLQMVRRRQRPRGVYSAARRTDGRTSNSGSCGMVRLPRAATGVLAGWADVPLTPRGVDRRRRCARRSPARRSTPSGAPTCGAPVETRPPGVRSRRARAAPTEINFGELEGHAWAALDPAVRRSFVEFDGFHPPGARRSRRCACAYHDFLAGLPNGRHLSSLTAG